MTLEVNTFPSPITQDMDLYLLLMIKTANNHIEQIANTLRNSKQNELDPNDGRKAIINIYVSSETGSISFERKYTLPKVDL